MNSEGELEYVNESILRVKDDPYDEYPLSHNRVSNPERLKTKYIIEKEIKNKSIDEIADCLMMVKNRVIELRELRKNIKDNREEFNRLANEIKTTLMGHTQMLVVLNQRYGSNPDLLKAIIKPFDA